MLKAKVPSVPDVMETPPLLTGSFTGANRGNGGDCVTATVPTAPPFSPLPPVKNGLAGPDYLPLSDAKCLQFVWKTKAMMDMLLAFTQLALDSDEFSAADLPQEMVHGGTGICGSCLAELLRQHIIKPVGIWQDRIFYAKEIATKREGRKRAKIGVYCADDVDKARNFLKAHHRYEELSQPELLEV